MPDTRTIVRGAVIGLGLVAIVGASVLVGRLTGEQPAAAQEQEAEAGATPAPTPPGAAAGGHDHGLPEENPYLVVPEDVETWSESIDYTDPESGVPFTIHVELEEPTTAGMGMCSMGPMASEYSRTVVISVRNDGGQAADGPRLGVDDKRIAFPHADGMGCSWNYPSGIDGSYEPGDVKTYRGLLKTEPVDQDALLILRPDEELFRIPADAFSEDGAASDDGTT